MPKSPEKPSKKEKHKDKDKGEKEHKKDKKKKGEPKLPVKFPLGARVEILSHEIESMCSRRGMSLGTFKPTDSPRKRIQVAIKLEGKRKKGATVDVNFISPIPHLRQRSFIGNIEPKHEKPTVYVLADDLKVLSAPGGDQDIESLQKSEGAQWWFTSLFGTLVGTFLRTSRAQKRVTPVPQQVAPETSSEPPHPNPEEEGADSAPKPASTQLGKLIHQLFESPFCEKYEEVIVNMKGYRNITMARSMTPKVFKEVATAATMTKSHMSKFRESLAPPDFESRSKYPIFSSY